MTMLRITSVSAPLNRPDLLALAMSVVRRALGLGLLSERSRIEKLDLDLIRSIAQEASSLGVGQEAAVALLERPRNARLPRLLASLDASLADSPVPDREIAELLRIYDHEQLAALAGTSIASLRRYASGARTVPDVVAQRIHFIALVTSDLGGAYNEFGLRRWWDRPRSALGDRSPRQALGTDWSADDPVAVTVAGLAAALVGAGS
ncbi:MAG: hypothetical protein IT341_01650 [Chloroflexi bacterium]|nr:hypothetical protein [Chloroflexota bacterium]